MTVEIVAPTTGYVTLHLPYVEAEVLLRTVGLTNSGNLSEHAPTLYQAILKLVDEFGRPGDDDARFGTRISGDQVYVYDSENPPF